MDQRTCIKFCVTNEIKCADAFRMLTVAYGEATLDRSNVYRWYKMFSEGREDVNDEERAGRPSTSTTDEKINEVEKMILANRRITVREVAEDLNISIGSCHSIFINDMGMRRVAAKFVPKLLNCDQKQHRMNIANEMLDSVRDDPNLLQRVITGDEAWVYGYDVETKAQSSQWKLPHEPRPKKTRQVRSNVKVLLTVFFDYRGVVHHEFLPQGRTVNKEYYLQVMRNLREAIRQKRPDLWKNKNWLLHHDNAPAHTSLLVRDLLAKNNTLMMPPYSPDLAPCDFFLFPKPKRPMKGRRYATLDEIKTASKEELKKIFKNDFLKCFEDWKNRWHKCMISHGDYLEGDKIEDHAGYPGISSQTIFQDTPSTNPRAAPIVAEQRLALGFHRRVKAKTSFQDDDVPIDDDTTTKPLFTPQVSHTEGNQVSHTEGIQVSHTEGIQVSHTEGMQIQTLGKPSRPTTKVRSMSDKQLMSPNILSGHSKVESPTRDIRVAAKFVPKLLNCDQKQHRMNIANDMLDSVRDDPNLLQRVITGDEA
ncbi:hypothetical protein LAZ67_4003283 [Cordylochernes scorpioides]|uniref:Mos1 transposase HTH domain-containing protein n=1 Tax=Cordylochernes scorpioides TaxID=51811 RepID=A0ABY6KDI7_9ARAC|nr:hypothetical protein LAZ67_4003283 [Cordylochernes scorpioides]